MSANPTPLFAAFARQERAADEVLRAVVSFDDYLAPPRGTPPGTGSPPGEVWVYTDADAVDRARAAGSDVGPLAPGLAGTDLFADVPAGRTAVRINPVSPPNLGWNVPREAFAALAAWVTCIHFERQVAGWAKGGGVSFDALVGYRHFQAYLMPDKAVLTMPNQHGLAHAAVVLTAPDCGRALLSRVPADLRAKLTAVFVTGAELVDKLPDQGVDGVILNPAGPGPTCPVRLTAPGPRVVG